MTLWQIMFLSEFIPTCLREADVTKVKELCNGFIDWVAQREYRDCDIVAALISLLASFYSLAAQRALPKDNVERRIVEILESKEVGDNKEASDE